MAALAKKPNKKGKEAKKNYKLKYPYGLHYDPSRDIPMFMSWKVPTRLVTADYNAVDGKKSVTENDVLSEVAKVHKKTPVKFVSKKQHEKTDTTHFSPPINHKMNLQSEAFERQAESAHYLSKTYPPPKKEIKAWESTLPKIDNGMKPQLIIKKKEKKYKAPIQSISDTLNPRTRSAAKRWLEMASEEDKIVVERVLMEAEKARNSKVLDRTLQPGAKSAVEKWMKGASEGEKLVAMEFFKSLAGQRLMGGPAGMAMDPSDRHAKRTRLDAVLKTLESSKGKTGVAIKLGAGGLSKSAPAGTTRLGPYVVGRLLSPQTRHAKMEYQTWHHMPVYPPNSRVENKGSMYIAPHGFVPRHFTIHPEWS
ncbi:uncharacterized protein [Branchiostoma lanceolatum]|uniref:uncharacterized protein isoform X2 n=1 Tax=Branchiostoma lanceolatum TaxID=7740 RepID=UPI003454A1C7